MLQERNRSQRCSGPNPHHLIIPPLDYTAPWLYRPLIIRGVERRAPGPDHLGVWCDSLSPCSPSFRAASPSGLTRASRCPAGGAEEPELFQGRAGVGGFRDRAPGEVCSLDTGSIAAR